MTAIKRILCTGTNPALNDAYFTIHRGLLDVQMEEPENTAVESALEELDKGTLTVQVETPTGVLQDNYQKLQSLVRRAAALGAKMHQGTICVALGPQRRIPIDPRPLFPTLRQALKTS